MAERARCESKAAAIRSQPVFAPPRCWTDLQPRAAVAAGHPRLLGVMAHRRSAGELEVRLWAAARDGSTDRAAAALRDGADPNALMESCVSALAIAAMGGHAAVVRLLLAAGARHHGGPFLGHTPLHVAASHGFVEVALALLDGGADAMAADTLGALPLHLAAWEGHAAMLTLLVARGTPVDARNGAGRTALWIATRRGNVHAVEELARLGGRM